MVEPVQLEQHAAAVVAMELVHAVVHADVAEVVDPVEDPIVIHHHPPA